MISQEEINIFGEYSTHTANLMIKYNSLENKKEYLVKRLELAKTSSKSDLICKLTLTDKRVNNLEKKLENIGMEISMREKNIVRKNEERM